jgi:hypothetical protein
VGVNVLRAKLGRALFVVALKNVDRHDAPVLLRVVAETHSPSRAYHQ